MEHVAYADVSDPLKIYGRKDCRGRFVEHIGDANYSNCICISTSGNDRAY